MKIFKTKFKDLIVVKSKIFYDKRGYFREISLEKQNKKRLIFTVISKSVAIDCRKNSKTFGKYFKIVLNDKNNVSIYIPPGFAHGFVSLKKENIVLYSCTDYRDKESESGIIWNDPDLNIEWPVKKPTLSSKDILNKPFNFYFG